MKTNVGYTELQKLIMQQENKQREKSANLDLLGF
jgi:hypothetical protein